jgi:hypothetical protein
MFFALVALTVSFSPFIFALNRWFAPASEAALNVLAPCGIYSLCGKGAAPLPFFY